MESRRVMAALAPVLLISVGYIDPGKWVACIDSGARFGGDLVPFAVLFNLVAVLCYHLSAHIGLITGKTLSQICSEEYDKVTCIFLGIQAELSVVCLDLTMILGIAHGLNVILGVDLFTCLLLTALNAVIYPVFSTLLESSKVKFMALCMAGLTFVCYAFGLLISLPEVPIPSSGFLSKFSGETAFALMSLLGSSVMPHNFYLHSSIVQLYQGSLGVSKGVWSHDSFIVTFVISSVIFLVNYVLMNSAANVFYSTGLGLLTFQDSMSLIDQVFKNPIVPFMSFVILFLANQISALSWEFPAEGGETMLHDFFNVELPEWLHRATVRIFSVVVALYCMWYSGTEGMYYMLLCTQVMVALLLPSSVIPLFRIASSRPIMGLRKISPVLEFVALLTFMGMLGLEIVFLAEMIFGESEWVGNLRWTMVNTTSFAYVLLLVTACVSISFILWLAAIPLKSVTARRESQPWSWDASPVVSESYTKREGKIVDNRCREEEAFGKQSLLEDNSLSSRPDLATANYDINLPESIMDTVPESLSTTIGENVAGSVPLSSSKYLAEPEHFSASESSAAPEVTIANSANLPSNSGKLSSTSISLKNESSDPVEKIPRVEGISSMGKYEDEGDNWEFESSKDTPAGQAVTPEGPGSFRSLSGKSDDGGASIGSLSRLSGLGRAARRQLAAALDEFWGQFYDFHGQLTKEAKSKKLDVLLGVVESKPSQSLMKSDSVGKDFGNKYHSMGGGVSHSLMRSGVSENPMSLNVYNAPKQQQTMQSNLDAAYSRFPRGSDIWSNQLPSLDSYLQNSSGDIPDAGERRFMSMRLPSSSNSSEYQPATVHGYQLASYVSRMAKERSDYVNGQLESAPQKSPPFVPNNYRDSLAYAMGQKSTNGFNSMQPSSYNLPVQRNSIMLSEKTSYDSYAPGLVDNLVAQNNSKKYHSTPNVSALTLPLRNSYSSDRSAQWDIPNTSTGFVTPVGRTNYDQSLQTSAGSRGVAPLAFDELSPSRPHRDPFAWRLNSGSETSSLYHKQPYEQFGVANKGNGTEGAGSGSNLMALGPLSLAETESKLLQTLRNCILKLLKLEGSEWLFRSNDGADEDLIDRVATRERFFYEVESRDLTQGAHIGDPQLASSGLVSSVPNCGEGCIWKTDLITSFGVWCIHRILELSLMESRPELWGKYTYVLNRLQGVIELAFFKPRAPISPCFCLQIPASYQMRSSPPVGNGMLPPTSRPAKGKVTTAAMMLEIIKDVEIAISCRKGRSGTAAGDVAFPKGKENLASVLKRYKRRLSNKPVGALEGGAGSRKLQSSGSFGL